MKKTFIKTEQLPTNILCLYNEKVKIQFSNIIMLEAKGNYTVIHTRFGKKIMVAKTLKSFEEVLKNHQFYRIHRAFMINANHLMSYNSILGEALLTNNQTVMTSRRMKISFEEKMNCVL